jgi:hypothetical protein
MATPRYQGTMKRSAILLVLLALPACGSEPGSSGATAGEAKALDDAAAMIEAKRLPESAVRPPAEQPAASGAAKQ